MFYKEIEFQDSLIGKIPRGWQGEKLETVVEIHDSKRIPLSEMERKDRKGPYPYCGANGIIDYINDFIFDGEYVLLAEDGGSYGKFENSAYVMSGKFWVNNHAHILRAIAGRTSNQFLKAVLDFLDLNLYIVGSTRRKLNQKQMRMIEIPLPPFEEQKVIVGVLGVVDSAIQKTDEVIVKTERLKKGLMQKLLTEGLGHKECKDTEIGRIPKDWKIARLGDVCSATGGGTPSKSNPEYWNGNIPWVSPEDMWNLEIWETQEHITERGLKESSTKLIKTNSILVVFRSGILKRRIPIAVNRVPVAINQDLKALMPKNDIIPEFIAYYLRAAETKILRLVKTGSTVQSLTPEGFFQLRIPIPSLSEQKRIVDIVLSADRKLSLEKMERGSLERVKAGLMDLLLTGKVRVRMD